MLKNILVPLDESATSLAVLPVVASLGAGLRVTLFAAARIPHGTESGPRRLGQAVPLAAMVGSTIRGVIASQDAVYAQTRGQAVERRENELIEFLAEAAAPLLEGGHRVELRVHLGDPIDEICRIARSGKIDLIAMASSSFGRASRGSVAESVLRAGVAPVLLVNSSPQNTEEPQSATVEN